MSKLILIFLLSITTLGYTKEITQPKIPIKATIFCRDIVNNTELKDIGKIVINIEGLDAELIASINFNNSKEV